MSHIIYNIGLNGLHALLDNFIVKTRKGKTFIAKKPRKPERESAAQRANRELFRKATQYAVDAMKNPGFKDIYTRLAGKHSKPFNMAMADYLMAPEISNINISGYGGKPGDVIRMLASDNGYISWVHVRILKENVVIEEGRAIERVGVGYVYTVKEVNANVVGCVVEIRARDMAGRETVVSVEIQSQSED